MANAAFAEPVNLECKLALKQCSLNSCTPTTYIQDFVIDTSTQTVAEDSFYSGASHTLTADSASFTPKVITFNFGRNYSLDRPTLHLLLDTPAGYWIYSGPCTKVKVKVQPNQI
jgi:hypothetical protein